MAEISKAACENHLQEYFFPQHLERWYSKLYIPTAAEKIAFSELERFHALIILLMYLRRIKILARRVTEGIESSAVHQTYSGVKYGI